MSSRPAESGSGTKRTRTPPANPAAAAPTDDPQDPIQAVIELCGGSPGGVVYVFRDGTGADKTSAYVLKMPVEDFADRGLDILRDKYGGGAYTIKLKDATRHLRGSRKLHIYGSPKEQPAVTATADPSTAGVVAPAAPAVPVVAAPLGIELIVEMFRQQGEQNARLMEQLAKRETSSTNMNEFMQMFEFAGKLLKPADGDGEAGGLAHLAGTIAEMLSAARPGAAASGGAGVAPVPGTPALVAPPVPGGPELPPAARIALDRVITPQLPILAVMASSPDEYDPDEMAVEIVKKLAPEQRAALADLVRLGPLTVSRLVASLPAAAGTGVTTEAGRLWIANLVQALAYEGSRDAENVAAETGLAGDDPVPAGDGAGSASGDAVEPGADAGDSPDAPVRANGSGVPGPAAAGGGT